MDATANITAEAVILVRLRDFAWGGMAIGLEFVDELLKARCRVMTGMIIEMYWCDWLMEEVMMMCDVVLMSRSKLFFLTVVQNSAVMRTTKWRLCYRLLYQFSAVRTLYHFARSEFWSLIIVYGRLIGLILNGQTGKMNGAQNNMMTHRLHDHDNIIIKIKRTKARRRMGEKGEWTVGVRRNEAFWHKK